LVISQQSIPEVTVGIQIISTAHNIATDISEGMIAQLRRKSELAGCKNISYEICSFNSTEQLLNKGPFDHIFSNFAGLNCSADLGAVLTGLDQRLTPGGFMTLVILPSFCLWETLLFFKGNWKTAFRRFTSKLANAKIDKNAFNCYYYQPSYITRHLKHYRLVSLKGLCTIVPPSYIQGFGNKYPSLFSKMKKLEKRFASSWPWRSIGDYYIITIQKVS